MGLEIHSRIWRSALSGRRINRKPPNFLVSSVHVTSPHASIRSLRLSENQKWIGPLCSTGAKVLKLKPPSETFNTAPPSSRSNWMKANFSGTFLNVRRRSRFAFIRLLRFIFGARGSLFIFGQSRGSGLRRCRIGRPRVGVGLACKPHNPQYTSTSVGGKEFSLGMPYPAGPISQGRQAKTRNPPPSALPAPTFFHMQGSIDR